MNTIEKCAYKNDCYVIAEIGVNHNGSIDEAINLIYKAKDAKVNAVKFQKRDLKSIYSDSIIHDSNSAEWNFDYLLPQLKNLELSEDDFTKIESICNELDLDLIVTPMDEASLAFISKLNLAAIKIASCDMTNIPLIKKCVPLQLPLLISTGMWDDETIKCCVENYNKLGINFCLLLSNSTYPSPYEDLSIMYLDKIKTYSKIYGYSGHERGIFIPIACLSLGARIIEKHITSSRSQKGPDHKASLEPDEFKLMVDNIRSTMLTLTDCKKVNQAETLNKELFAKSVTALVDLKEGDRLNYDNITLKSPGKGIFGHEVPEFINKRLKRNVNAGSHISKNDFTRNFTIRDWEPFLFKNDWGVKCRFHDYLEYKELKSKVIEFHCSESDLDIPFIEKNQDSKLIVHAPEIMDRELVNICSENESIVNKSLNIIQKTINKVLSMASNWPKATPRVVVHLGGMSLNKLSDSKYGSVSLSNHDKMIEIAINNFKRLEFDPALVNIIPENLPPRPWYLGGEWYQYGFGPADDLIKFANATSTKITYDICHAALWCNMSGECILDYTKRILPVLSHLHISDATGINGEGIQIGKGEIPLSKVLTLLKGYEFSWVTEIWSGHLNGGYETNIAMKYLSDNYRHIL